MTKFTLKACFLVISLCFIAPNTAQASIDSAEIYKAAFKELNKKKKYSAQHAVYAGPNVILNKVLQAELMALPGNDYSFDELANFIIENPNWPRLKGIITIAEQKIPAYYSSKQVIRWFEKSPPVSFIGIKRYVKELKKVGKLQTATNYIRDWWINHDFSNGEYKKFYSRFSGNFRAVDHFKRTDRLIWEKKYKEAKRMFQFLNIKTTALMLARISLSKNQRSANKYINKVPKDLLNNEGLLYERMRWRRKRNMNSGVKEILHKQPTYLAKPAKWWGERHIVVRRLMERKKFRAAYNLASKHGLKSNDGFPYLQAEFISGFLALRKINQPKLALKSFKRIVRAAKTPISRGRAHYWLGRAYEALGRNAKAKDAYEEASTLNTTYYGQLALTKLNKNPIIHARPETPVPRNLRNAFYKHSMTQAIMNLDRIGLERRAERFFRAAVKGSKRRADFALLLDLAYKSHRPDWAVKAAKAANKKNIIISGSAYPVLAMRIPKQPELALTHALIRQESEFRSKAGSRVGAQGLMQLMPSTAKSVARKLRVRYRRSALSDPSYNVLLGTSFIQRQINNFDGSYILALAGYNAGPSRAHKWIKMFGDPRDREVNAIDWIELIPIYETRNYIMRIMENLQFYRARLNKGKAPLQILYDLKR